MRHFVGCLVLGLCLAATAPASVIFNNGLPNQASADLIASTIGAEDFFVSAASLLTSFEFWDVEDNASGAYNGSITWLLYTDLAGMPGSILAQGNASTAGQITRTQNIGVTCCVGFNEFDNVVNLAASLTSGSLSVSTGTYWLGLYDGPLGNTDFQDFYWETTANNTSAFGRLQDQTVLNAGWDSALQEHAFNISGTTTGEPAVPEPSTLWLSLGPAGLAMMVRKFGFRRTR